MTTINQWHNITAILSKYPTRHDAMGEHAEYLFGTGNGSILLDTDPAVVSEEDKKALEELRCTACPDGHEQGDGPCFEVYR